MDEVRSYWQVASISHFCNLFGRPFKLPTFEPEELEQAFVLEIPPPPVNSNKANTHNNTQNNHISTSNGDSKSTDDAETTGKVMKLDPDEQDDDSDHDHDSRDNKATNSINDRLSCDDDPDWEAPKQSNGYDQQLHEQPAQQQADEQQELHLLVKLAIALMKPHFNSKISHANWENYLRRLVDKNWVELEHHPSPFRVPIITQDGVELTKNLGFNELSLSDKIDLFYALCDYRLWCEDAAEAIKDYTLEELRLESVGKDSHGYEYWYFSGTRLFRENRDLSREIIFRKKRIKELEYNLIELEKDKIFRENEEKRKAEIEKARKLAAEAKEARLVAKKQQEEASKKKRKLATPVLPPRTGLRERRSSTTSNNNDSMQSRTPTTRSKLAKQQPEQQQPQTNEPKSTRNTKSGRGSTQREKTVSPDLPKKSPDEECRDELSQLVITSEDRAEAWCIQCESLEEWESFATKFEKTKSVNEKNLSTYINIEILPKIRAVYAKRAAEARKKEKEMIYSLASRRVSTRIISRQAQEEEKERQAQLHEAEMRRKKAEAEVRLRAELEREMKARMAKVVVQNGGTSSTCSEDGDEVHSGRYNLRQAQNQSQQPSQYFDELVIDSEDFDGIIHPAKMSEFYEALELVIDTVRTSKHAWPFVDPVPDTVPGYYDLIKKPMDLRKLRTKIEFREYKSLIELEKDFQLLVNNCEQFNGPRNVYTKMVYKLWKSFRKNVRLYLQRDLSMNEQETFIHPPPEPPRKPKEVPLPDEQPMMQPKQESVEIVTNQQDESTKGKEVDVPVSSDDAPLNNETINQGTTVAEQTREVGCDPSEAKSDEMMSSSKNAHLEQNGPQDQHDLAVKLESRWTDIKPAEKKIVIDLPVPVKLPDAPMESENLSDQEEPKAPTPEPILMDEEIIIDSYDVPCPDESFFTCPQESEQT